ncbi:MAG: hypothetical protein CV045_03260 [Cyanobacteria bacterium M5B4]|nr:MAG: hypothetical protein CV045_03260 [Cyanobacteria bacterium M5B4]
MVWLIAYNLIFWSLVTLILLNYWQVFRSGWQSVRELHRIPCSRCVYFTGNYRLKCTVNPGMALSIDAIGCRDFENKSNNYEGTRKN